MKRILLLVVLFASLLVLSACGSTRNPMISDPDGVYLTAKEGANTYNVTRRRVYDLLKDQVGYSMLKDVIDTDLLKNTKNNDGKSYWDLVTQAEIDEKLDADIFPNGTEELTESEIAEQRQAYYDKLFEEYGLMTEAEIKNHYQLNIAKEKYALDQLLAQLGEKDFTETELKNYFNNNFKDEYYAIVVSFDSERMLKNTLSQLGYKFNEDNVLAHSDGTALTKNEVVKLFIDLYNIVNISKVEDYPTQTLLLQEGTHYNLANGNIVFDLEEVDMLHYTNRQITSYESGIEKALNTMDNYDEGDNFYTKTPRIFRNGARYSMFLKIDHIKYDFNEKEEEVREALTKQRLTSPFINTEIGKLRIANNLVVYDRDINLSFEEEASTFGYSYKNKATHKVLVAKTDVKEYTADDLFKIMNRNYGISSAISELEFNRFVDNLDLNYIYDFKKKEILDASRWQIITQSIKDEKANFKNNLYEEEGYPASMGWDKFIKAVYGANNETELEKFFVFQDIRDRFSKSLGALEGLDENSDLWKFYLAQMQKMVDEYFRVTGVHLLITVYDNNNNPVDPENWTEIQKQYAEEFYNQVMDFINDENFTETPEKKIQNIQNAFNRAPLFVPGLPQDTASQPEIDGISYVYNGIEVSKFKSAGLSATFQDLGTFTNGTMVQEFNDAAKSIWEADSDSKETVVYGNTKDEQGNYEYLVTEFGYHIYVNTKTHPIEEYSSGKVLPTHEDAVEFIKDNNSTNLTTKLKTALNKYFKPIHTELTSTNNLQLVSYRAIRGLEIELHHEDYTIADFNKFLDLTIKAKEDSLKYK